MSYKGDWPRKVDRKKWDSCPLWKTREARLRKEKLKNIKDIHKKRS